MAHTPTKNHTAKKADQPETPVPETEVKKQEAEAAKAAEHFHEEPERKAPLPRGASTKNPIVITPNEPAPTETWGERQARESIEAEKALAAKK